MRQTGSKPNRYRYSWLLFIAYSMLRIEVYFLFLSMAGDIKLKTPHHYPKYAVIYAR